MLAPGVTIVARGILVLSCAAYKRTRPVCVALVSAQVVALACNLILSAELCGITCSVVEFERLHVAEKPVAGEALANA